MSKKTFVNVLYQQKFDPLALTGQHESSAKIVRNFKSCKLLRKKFQKGDVSLEYHLSNII